MNTARRIYLPFSLAIIFSVCSLYASAEMFWAEHKFTSAKPPIRTACLMPAEAEIDKFGVKAVERMPRESDSWAVALDVLVEAHLRAVGIVIDTAADPLTSGASDNDIQQAIEQIQEKYNSLSHQLDKNPRAIDKGSYTLGDQVAMLPCAANSDVLVVIRGAGAVPSGGREAMGALAGTFVTQNAIVTITFADAKTGEILAMTRFHNVGDFITNWEDGLGGPLDTGLADLNLGSARKHESDRERSTPAEH